MLRTENIDRIWPLFKEMLGRRIRPETGTLNIILNSLCMQSNTEKAEYFIKKMEDTSSNPTVVTYNTHCSTGIARTGN